MSTVEAKAGVAKRRLTPWQTAVSLQSRYPIIQLLALAAVYVYGAATLEGLGSWQAVRSILVLASLAGLAAMGQTMLIIMGGFDMSVPGFISVGSITAVSLVPKWGIPFWVGILGALAFAAIIGGLAGWICHRLDVQPLIITLATGAIAVGTVQVGTGGMLAGGAPTWLIDRMSTSATTFSIGIPPLIIIWVVVAVLLGVFLHRTGAGRRVLATGANTRAADYSLVRTRRVWTVAFAFSAMVSVVVGVMLAGFAGSVDPNIGNPYLFQGVAAVIVGGTIFGGPGDYSRTVVGALFLTVVSTVLVGHGASAADQQILYGSIILIAVAMYGRSRRLRDRV